VQNEQIYFYFLTDLYGTQVEKT